jgi:hypothetical protein
MFSIFSHALAADDLARTGETYSVIMEDNAFYENNLAGIRIRGTRRVNIKSCKIYSNGRAGIITDKQAQLRVADCDIFQNGRAGINVDEASRLTIENSRIYANVQAGVRLLRSVEREGSVLEVNISNNRIFRNLAGIRSMPEPESHIALSVVENDIYQNQQSGVRVQNDTVLTARGNSIYENGRAGIIATESVVPSRLDIYQNTLSFNRTAGIHVVNGVTGNIGIRNNWVYNNDLSGIICGLWNNPDIELIDVEIINNTVVSNGSRGLQQDSMVVLTTVTEQGAGIRNDSKGKALIMNNIVAYNYVTGIRTRKCGDSSYNLLFANGDIANCCDDPNSAPYWIERLQVAGCTERGKGDLITMPLFVDPDNYNFHLQDGSPAIDTGVMYDDTSFPPSKGTTRNDMGATGGPWARSGEQGAGGME